MSFDWPHFLSLAEKLIHTSKDASLEEAYFRTSVSRAYYSVYGIAAQVLNNVGSQYYAVPIGNAHKHVRDKFSEGDTRIQKQIGDNLQRLWNQRRKADYEGSEKHTCNKEQSTKAVERARTIQTLLEDPNACKFK